MRDKLPQTFVDLGERRLKNIVRPMRAYALAGAGPKDLALPPAGTASLASAGSDAKPVRALAAAAAGTLDSLGRLIGAYADKVLTAGPSETRVEAGGARGLDDKRRARRLRRIIIAAAVLSAIASRACTERHSLAPPAPSPPRAGAADEGLAKVRLAAGFDH